MNDDVHTLSGAYVLDAVDDDERRAFEAHLAQCPDCAREVDELRAVVARLGDDVDEEPPAGLRSSVLAAIDTVRPLPPVVHTPQEAADAPAGRPTGRRKPSTWLLAAAAALLIVVAGVLAWSPWSRQGNKGLGEVAAAVVNAPDARRQEKPIDGSTATLVVSRSRDRAVILSDDMPPPPAGHTYQLWYQRPGKGMVPAGLMATSAGRNAFVLDGPLGDATAVGVTVEPAGGSPEPTTTPVAVFAI